MGLSGHVKPPLHHRLKKIQPNAWDSLSEIPDLIALGWGSDIYTFKSSPVILKYVKNPQTGAESLIFYFAYSILSDFAFLKAASAT